MPAGEREKERVHRKNSFAFRAVAIRDRMEFFMRKKKQNPKEALSLLTESQRLEKQAQLEKQRLRVTKELEQLMLEISRVKSGAPVHMRYRRRLGRRPNDVLDD